MAFSEEDIKKSVAAATEKTKQEEKTGSEELKADLDAEMRARGQ